ncbi:hypothetical protein BKA61DRAFT_563492 [Leptodontidium sp. MPI-SDFR-AT-0119]|nr:hypothetical protein BKA61DRAFT_563492 [Leptodontidium sp. MPI-SDFR-AT-0119]
MSTKSDPSMVVSHGSGSREKQVGSPMLDKYLADPPTITEKLSPPQPPKETTEVVGDTANATKCFLGKWQASWERKG